MERRASGGRKVRLRRAWQKRCCEHGRGHHIQGRRRSRRGGGQRREVLPIVPEEADQVGEIYSALFSPWRGGQVVLVPQGRGRRSSSSRSEGVPRAASLQQELFV